MNEIPLDFLARFELFHKLDLHQLEKIRTLMKIQNFQENQVILKEGKSGTDLFVLLEGEVSITKELMLKQSGTRESETDKSLASFNADMHISLGEAVLIGDAKRMATVRTLKPSKFGLFDRDQFAQLCEEDNQLAYIVYRNLASILSQRLNQANLNIMKLSTAFVLALEHGS